ncbi:MAG TPA: HlyD family efflux transporter periplasmic adaptor subunit [Gammaproteobacteria bacterium]|jgi:HlyD family secretion protein|nr:HlyD family efflux transporter periplasmic adaptor subunit [Gammaproteobacteria bacterium]
MRIEIPAGLLVALSLAGCGREAPQALIGTLEWDRIAVTAELAEPVLRWDVAEGDRVEAGTVLLEIDPSRQDARIAEARGNLAMNEGKLAELTHGARIETIDAARANLASAHAAEIDGDAEYTRVAELRKRELVAQSQVDQALATRNQRRAATRAAEAQLEELTHGTRPEQIEQAAAAVDAARAALETLELTRARLTVRAPRAGRVDALPFRVGDQPPVGAELVSMLVGDAPYARVYVPADRRADLKQGDRFEVRVQGVAQTFTAKLRSIRSEPSFTPYYALAGDDASRLVYRAELLLEGTAGADLPAGLPASAVKLP